MHMYPTEVRERIYEYMLLIETRKDKGKDDGDDDDVPPLIHEHHDHIVEGKTGFQLVNASGES
jgi:hypothetical protein